MKLFREEAQAALVNERFGTVLLRRPISFAIITGLTALLGSSLVLFCMVGEINRKTRIAGVLIPEIATVRLVAPQTGVVRDIRIADGEEVNAGDVLLTLHSDKPLTRGAEGNQGETRGSARTLGDVVQVTERLQAKFLVPSRAVGFVRSGQSVHMKYAAYPYQKYGVHAGQVVAVSDAPLVPSELPKTAAAHEPFYRVTVALDSQSIHANGQTWLLKPGLAVEADVVQERQKIWEWVLGPILTPR